MTCHLSTGCRDPWFCRAAGDCILRPLPRNEKGRSHGSTEPDTQASGSFPAISTAFTETERLRGVGKHTNERRGASRSLT
jgi:hypothetical protein